jgi:peptidyl-prolyl cis-trans isomerase SurA
MFYLPVLFSQTKVVDQVVAVVGSKPILLSDIENQFYQLKSQGYESPGDAKCEILEDLMYQKLLLNQADLDSVEVSAKEVESTLDSRFRYFISEIGSEEKLEEYFGKSIIEMKEDFRENIKEQLLTQRMQEKITGDIKITPSEVRTYFQKIHPDSLPYFNTEIELQQIVLKPKVSLEEKTKVREKINELRERIINGDKFSTLAVLYSEDPGSSKKGGELGFLSRGELVPEFAAVAFNLKETEVSKIVETEFGFHIIQLIERKGDMANVRHILLTPKPTIEEVMIIEKRLDSIAKEIRNGNLTFENAVLKYSEDEQSKNNNGVIINNYTGNTKFETNQIDAPTSYAIRDLNVGDISKVFQSSDERGKLSFKFVKLKSKSLPHKANLADDYQRIQEIALEQKKQKTISNWIANQQNNTYIKIDESFGNCKFDRINWSKNKN